MFLPLSTKFRHPWAQCHSQHLLHMAVCLKSSAHRNKTVSKLFWNSFCILFQPKQIAWDVLYMRCVRLDISSAEQVPCEQHRRLTASFNVRLKKQPHIRLRPASVSTRFNHLKWHNRSTRHNCSTRHMQHGFVYSLWKTYSQLNVCTSWQNKEKKK